jgi:hypothetical protein
MGTDWICVPPINNMNKLYQHLSFNLKPIYDVELVIFHLDQVLILLARCFVDKWFLFKQLWVLLWVQQVPYIV